MVGDILADPVLHPVLMKVVQEMDLGDLFEEPDESQGEDAAIMAKSMLMNAPLRLIINFGQGQYNEEIDRKSTRLNSSHVAISYAVFCLKKKKKTTTRENTI